MSHFAYLDDIKAPALEAPRCGVVQACLAEIQKHPDRLPVWLGFEAGRPAALAMPALGAGAGCAGGVFCLLAAECVCVCAVCVLCAVHAVLCCVQP